jgi:hypothetical protein
LFNELVEAASSAAALPLLATALVLGIRHGIDWDHIAAIADITSTTAAGDAGERAHLARHARGAQPHAHGGEAEFAAHQSAEKVTPGRPRDDPTETLVGRLRAEHGRALLLGTLYALGHATVVALLGFLALTFGTLLPDWVDPIMSRVVGVTLIVLGIWVFYSVYAYVRHGAQFRLRSRWMLVFDSVRYAWRWLRARLHGHDHVNRLRR